MRVLEENESMAQSNVKAATPTLAERIAAHNWPIPKRYEAGPTYKYVPIDQYSRHIDDGWKFQALTHRFEGVEYFLVSRGDVLTHVRASQTPIDLQVWIPDDKMPPRLSGDLLDDGKEAAATL